MLCCVALSFSLCLCPSRVIRYAARADTPGIKTNVATLINVDAIENNQQSAINISITTNCGSPFGNATRLTCPVNTMPIGNDSLVLSAATVASFQATCCVSKPCSAAATFPFSGAPMVSRRRPCKPYAAPCTVA